MTDNPTHHRFQTAYEGKPPWDLGRPQPPFVEVADQITGSVLDAGCGTGETLRMLRDGFKPAYLGGFDLSAEALARAREKVPQADLYESDICDPAIKVDNLDLLISLDVIYIPGLARALPGLKRLSAKLRSGGLCVLNLPAYNWLYSTHDIAVHTSQRFVARDLIQLLEELDFEVEILSYRLCLLFPLVVLKRLPGILKPRSAASVARSDLHGTPSKPLNTFLYGIVRAENELISRGVSLPWGSSVFAIGKKR